MAKKQPHRVACLIWRLLCLLLFAATSLAASSLAVEDRGDQRRAAPSQLLARFREFAEANEWRQALAEFNRLHQEFPDNAEIAVYLGRIYTAQHRTDAALDAFMSALELAALRPDGLPTESWTYHYVGMALRHDNSRGAASWFEASLQLAVRLSIPELVSRNLNVLADMARKAGDPAGASERLERSLQMSEQTGYDEGEGYAAAMLGELALDAEDYETANSCLLDSLMVRQKLGDAAGQAFCLGRLAQIGLHQGDLAAARGQLQAALPLLGAAAGDARSRAFTWLSLAEVDSRLRDYERQAADLERANAEFERANDRSGLARTWRELAENYSERGQPERAQAALDKSRDLAAALPPTERARALASKAKLLRQQGQFAEALEDFKTAQRAFEAADNDLEAAWVRYDIGKTLYQLDEIQSARAELEAAGRVFERSQVRDRLAEVQLWLAKAESRQGDFDRALSHFESAQTAFRRRGMLRAEAEALSGAGMTFKRMGNLSQATATFAETAASFHALDDARGEAFAFNNLGIVQYMAGNFSLAESRFNEALELFRQRRDREGERYALRGLGTAYFLQSRPREALASFMTALRIRPRYRTASSDAYLWESVGRVYAQLGLVKEAGISFRTCLSLADSTGDEQGLLAAHAGLAALALKVHDEADAIIELESSVQIMEHRRARLVAEESMNATSAQTVQTYNLLARLLHGRGDTDRALRIWDRGRARAFLEQLEQAALNPHAHAEALLLARDTELKRLVTELQIAQNAAESDAGEPPSGVQTRLQQAFGRQFKALAEGDAEGGESTAALLGRALEKVENDIRSNDRRMKTVDPAFAAFTDPDPLDVAAFRRQTLRADEALLGYLLGDEGSLLFVVTPDEVLSIELPPAGQIAAAVTEFMAKVLSPQRDPAARLNPRLDFSARVGNDLRLYELLLEPALPFLAHTQKLLIVPDGALHNLSFAAVPCGFHDDGAPEFLIERYAVELAPSATACRWFRQTEKPWEGPSALIAAGAAHPPKPLPELAMAADELKFIKTANAAIEVSSIEGYQATEASFKALDFSRFRWLYLGAHALLNQEQPLSSAIALTADAAGLEDGMLEAREIMELRIPCELVVLSACDTAGGKNVAGEGLLSLARSFFYAGSHAVIGSLAPVPEAPTLVLMTRLFAHLGTAPTAEALMLAQREMIADRDPLMSHPLSWGLFVPIGD